MYREFEGIACVGDFWLKDRNTTISTETLERLHKQFLYKPLWVRKDLSGHTSWEVSNQIGTITSVHMDKCLMKVKGILHRHIPSHTSETLGLSIDTNLPNVGYSRRQYYGIHFGLKWKMDEFIPKGITLIYQHLAAIPHTTFNLC